MVGRVLFVLLLATVGTSRAQVPPDLTPVKCAWASFTPQQQERLRNAFVVDNKTNQYRHNRASDRETAAAAQACKLTYGPAQLGELAGALGYKAREEVSRMGISARGLVKAQLIDRAVENLRDERRAEIGDRLACPGGYTMESEWDRSVIMAIRRTGTKTMDGVSVSLIGLGVYAIVAQEGHMRRILGTNPPCPPPEQ
ncbi:MAG: hypothetical protein SGI91_07270 [Alphaproteobacteria bacterium]|nr:hypothetical protein [Alphaproteobacteria bacterium]